MGDIIDPAPAPAPAPARSQDPAPEAPWITMFPKDLRGDDMLAWGRTPAEMLGTVRGALKQNSEMKAALEGFRKGVPQAEDEYTFSVPEEFRESIDPEQLKSLQKMAFKLKLPASAAQELLDFDIARNLAARKAYKEAGDLKTKAVMDELRAEYKDKTETVLEDAFRVVSSLGGKELHDALKNDMGNNKVLIKAFIKLAPLLTERGIQGGGSASGGGTPAEGEIDLREVYGKSYNSMIGKS